MFLYILQDFAQFLVNDYKIKRDEKLLSNGSGKNLKKRWSSDIYKVFKILYKITFQQRELIYIDDSQYNRFIK